MFKMAPSSLLSLLFMTAVFSSANADSLKRRDLEAPQDLDNDWEYQGCYVYEAPSLSMEGKCD